MTASDRILRRLSSALAKYPGTTNAQIAAIAAHQFDVLGCTFRDILDAHQIGQAGGASLDRIVALLDLVRNPNETDEQLRNRFYVELSRRQVSGTRADILAAIATISDWEYGTDFTLLEPPDIPAPSRDRGAFCIDLLLERGDLGLETQSALGTILQASKPAGILPIIRHHRTLPAAAIGAGMFRTAVLDLLPSPYQYPNISLNMGASVGTVHPTKDSVLGFETVSGWDLTAVNLGNSSEGKEFTAVLSAGTEYKKSGTYAAKIMTHCHQGWAGVRYGKGYGYISKNLDMSSWGYLKVSFLSHGLYPDYHYWPTGGMTISVQIDDTTVASKVMAGEAYNAEGSRYDYYYENTWYDFIIDVRAFSGIHTLKLRADIQSDYDRDTDNAIFFDDLIAIVPA
ncbi:MAG: hypothetical protein PHP59_10205 [Methanofollis sp.]|uniref:hypothetical protein n=1 Tax=Methanofollis sp. TaxID=2052835 RepID=UPI00261CAC41|nr:hypothetical protein [Methanofollis sp.]MDD4255729.1 hypothetical protein [Methanofollis sp.]